jgi:hypothetical protein
VYARLAGWTAGTASNTDEHTYGRLDRPTSHDHNTNAVPAAAAESGDNNGDSSSNSSGVAKLDGSGKFCVVTAPEDVSERETNKNVELMTCQFTKHLFFGCCTSNQKSRCQCWIHVTQTT